MPARLVYSLLWLLALPIVFLRLAIRARRQPAYLRHLGERLGRYPRRDRQPVIWIHAVSVGETRAAEPLVRALRSRWPDHRILLTHMTPTGRETAATLFAKDPGVVSVYLPYDVPVFADRFFKHFQPRLGVIMETELWPNLLAAARWHGVPVLLANARLSERSARRYARWPTLTRLTLGALSCIGSQTDADARRLSERGARDVSVTGNIKFDIAPPAALLELGRRFRARTGGRPIVLAASTREGEEALILDAFLTHFAESDVLLMLVPRHPQRFNDVAAMIEARGLTLQRRSDERDVSGKTQVWLGDSMGEMFAYYAACDVALIGGSWLPFGGQNLIEACAVGAPVVLGPHTYNFSLVAEQAVGSGAALRADDVAGGMAAAHELLADAGRRSAVGTAGQRFAEMHRGATERTMMLVERLLAAPDKREGS